MAGALGRGAACWRMRSGRKEKAPGGKPRQLHGKGLRGAGWERLAGDSRCPLVAFRVGAAAPHAPPRCEGSERPNSTTRPGLGGRSGVRNTVSVRFHISLR